MRDVPASVALTFKNAAAPARSAAVRLCDKRGLRPERPARPGRAHMALKEYQMQDEGCRRRPVGCIRHPTLCIQISTASYIVSPASSPRELGSNQFGSSESRARHRRWPVLRWRRPSVSPCRCPSGRHPVRRCVRQDSAAAACTRRAGAYAGNAVRGTSVTTVYRSSGKYRRNTSRSIVRRDRRDPLRALQHLRRVTTQKVGSLQAPYPVAVLPRRGFVAAARPLLRAVRQVGRGALLLQPRHLLQHARDHRVEICRIGAEPHADVARPPQRQPLHQVRPTRCMSGPTPRAGCRAARSPARRWPPPTRTCSAGSGGGSAKKLMTAWLRGSRPRATCARWISAGNCEPHVPRLRRPPAGGRQRADVARQQRNGLVRLERAGHEHGEVGGVREPGLVERQHPGAIERRRRARASAAARCSARSVLTSPTFSVNTRIGFCARLASAASSCRFSSASASGSSPGAANRWCSSCSAVSSCAGTADPLMPCICIDTNGDTDASCPASSFWQLERLQPAGA